MPRKSRQRKSHGQRPLAAEKTAPIVRTTHQPWQIAAVCVVLVTVTVIAFRSVRSSDFLTYDDIGYILENQHVQQGVTMQNIAWAFTTFFAANWHPLTWISHMVDWCIYGNSPGGHHITNVCLHAANAVVLFLLLLYMTGFLGRSAMVAFLFALHPAHVESVAWIAERKDLLCTLFWFATLLAYAWYVRKPSWKRFAWVICSFACALMSKPMAVTLPFTLLLFDFWPLRRTTFTTEDHAHWLFSFWKLCVEKWLVFLMAVLSGIITIFAQRSGGTVAALQALPLWERVCNAAISYCRYVRIMFWPDPLTAYYYYDVNHIKVFAAVLSILALVLVTAVCWYFRKERPYCLIGWLWFLGTLAPVIGIMQVGEQAMAERYTYVPFIGLFIAVVWLAGDAVAKFPKIRIAALLLAVVVITACAVKTDAQVKVWKDSVTLFNHVLEINQRGAVPNFCLGLAYMRQGRNAEAQEYFERALVYNPYRPLILSFSAYSMMRFEMQTHDRRNLPLAEQRLEKVLRIAPDDPEALTDMALWFALMGRPKDEEMYSRKAIAATPDFVRARIYLADALQIQGKLDQAVQEYRQALAIDPEFFDAHNSLGFILAKQGLTGEALKEFRLSLSIQPNQAIPHYKIGRILLETHHLPEAAGEFTQALRFDPANAHAHNDLGVALFQMGENEKAAEQFSDALRIDPDYADARRNLDVAQAMMKNGKVEQARK
jgi:tetratricopeptide (TPR) repeat protein